MSACGSTWLGLVPGYMIWSLHGSHVLYVSTVEMMSSWLEVSSICLLVSMQCGYCLPCGLCNYGIFSGACSRIYFGFGFLLPSYLYIICLLLLWHVTFDLDIFLHLIKKKKELSMCWLERETRERRSPSTRSCFLLCSWPSTTPDTKTISCNPFLSTRFLSFPPVT